MMKKFFLLAVILFAAPAFAGEVDFSTILTNEDNAPIPDCTTTDCAGKPPLTLGRLAMHVLAANFPDEQNLSGEEKFKRGELALRVYKGGKVNISVEEAALVKKLVAKGYGPLIILKSWPMLDGATGK